MTKEIIEVTSPDGTRNHGILVFPPGQPPFPGILAVHGGMGGWSEQELSLHASEKLPGRLAREGYAVLVCDYRHLSLGLGDVQDTVAAYRTLCADARIDAKRVALVGCSHGGVNSLLASTQIRPKCIVAEEAQSDFLEGWEILQDLVRRSSEPLPPHFKMDPGLCTSKPLAQYARMDQELWAELCGRLGGLPTEVPEAFIAVSPYTKVQQIHSPLLILSGDSNYRPSSVKMHGAMLGAGKICELRLYDNAPHAFLWNGASIPATEEAFRDLCDFLRRHLVGCA